MGLQQLPLNNKLNHNVIVIVAHSIIWYFYILFYYYYLGFYVVVYVAITLSIDVIFVMTLHFSLMITCDLVILISKVFRRNHCEQHTLKWVIWGIGRKQVGFGGVIGLWQ